MLRGSGVHVHVHVHVCMCMCMCMCMYMCMCMCIEHGCVPKDGRALEFAPPELQADREVVLAARCGSRQDGRALVHAPVDGRVPRWSCGRSWRSRRELNRLKQAILGFEAHTVRFFHRNHQNHALRWRHVRKRRPSAADVVCK
jgi:hypothetical protein